MAKLEQIHRLMLVAEFLKGKPSGITYQETKNYLERKFEEKGFELKFSEKTFKRDREMISEILGIESNFKRSSGTFKINNEELELNSETILDNVLLIDAYRKVQENSEIIIFEKRKPRGLHHLSDLVYAIKKHRVVSFQYHKFYEEEPEKKVVTPYALKEFKSRWYLLAVDFQYDNRNSMREFERNGKWPKNDPPKIKTFGLDRIYDVEISNTRQLKSLKNIENAFSNSFGIISTLGENPEEITLSFSGFQGKYIKSFPLHFSQEIISEKENEMQVKVRLVPTIDFYQELLSYSGSIKIISPAIVKAEFVNYLKQALEQNQ